MTCMLRTTTAFKLGIHALALLARHPGRLISAREIAGRCRVSEAHLAKVLQALVRGGLLKGERGPAGGVELSRRPEDISLLDAWEVIEGRPQTAECPFAIPTCRRGLCSLGKKLDEYNRRIESLMKKTTLVDLDCMAGVCVPEAAGLISKELRDV